MAGPVWQGDLGTADFVDFNEETVWDNKYKDTSQLLVSEHRVNDQPINVQQQIDFLERRHLDGAAPPHLAVWGNLDAGQLLRVRGLANFWRAGGTSQTGGEEPVHFEQHMEDLISGWAGLGLGVVHCILGRQRGVEVYLGLQPPTGKLAMPTERLLAPDLRGAFPGIQLDEHPVKVGSMLRKTRYFDHMGRLTGVPTRKAGFVQRPEPGTSERRGQVQQVERLLRALAGEDFGYMVVAKPLPTLTVVRDAQQGLELIRQVSTLVKLQRQIGATTSGEQLDRQAQYCVEALERNLQRLNQGKAQGMWEVEVTCFAPTQETLLKLLALLRGVYGGLDSRPDPVRTFPCRQGLEPSTTSHFATALNSAELATLCQLPKEEAPGYAVADHARFDVALPDEVIADRLPIGRVLDGKRHTGEWYAIDRGDFAKHGLVVGVTGSGKTNTVFYLLDKLWNEARIPFLVIEPAKTEYRDLLTAGFGDLRVYTLGDETIAPFRLNPFEFEIAGPDLRTHVQTHVDFLKSVFNAAFILYAPMPYVLETCLHEVYQDKGWDLTTSQNRRLPPQERGNEANWPVFPTLRDLYEKIDDVVDRLGYDQRIQMDVKAGLKARIGSLLLGGKGLMLDTRHGVSIADLLARPTVLELERVGNDDEKAFLIGLILTRLYECRQVQAKGRAAESIKHVTVFEEAHRLLKNVPTQVETESANTRGQAVEAFANMLSEIRAYGEGVLIADQVPTKLAPDAIKNTNLKLMHRIVAADDREVMAGAMNLDEAQSRHIITLSTGVAAAFAEGSDRPYLVEVFNFMGQRVKGRATDAQVAQTIAPQLGTPIYEPLPDYFRHFPPHAGQPARPDSTLRDYALSVIEHPDFDETFHRYFLSLVEEPDRAILGYNDILQLMRRAVGKLRPPYDRQTPQYVLLHATHHLLDQRGRQIGWLYNVASSLCHQISNVLVDVALCYENRQDVLDRLRTQHRPALDRFRHGYIQQTAQDVGPFVGCVHCQARCRYRREVAPLVRDAGLERDFLDAIRTARSDQEIWPTLADICREAAGRAINVSDPQVTANVALCFAAQLGPAVHFTSATQVKLARNLSQTLANSHVPAAPSTPSTSATVPVMPPVAPLPVIPSI